MWERIFGTTLWIYIWKIHSGCDHTAWNKIHHKKKQKEKITVWYRIKMWNKRRKSQKSFIVLPKSKDGSKSPWWKSKKMLKTDKTPLLIDLFYLYKEMNEYLYMYYQAHFIPFLSTYWLLKHEQLFMSITSTQSFVHSCTVCSVCKDENPRNQTENKKIFEEKRRQKTPKRWI